MREAFVLFQLGVSDHPVVQGVRDFELDGVDPVAQQLAYLQVPRRAPDRACLSPVDLDGGNPVEPADMQAVSRTVRLPVEGCPVCGCA